MSINIKNREAEELIAELKRRTGKGTTDLLLDLLRREKAKSDSDREAAVKDALEETRRLQERWARLPVIDPRPFDEIVAFDDDGLPI
jgi:hypothetical protein